MKLKQTLINLAVLVVTTLICLALSEGVLRFTVTPSDFLSVEMVADPILGAVPSPSTRSGGFDAWGFRNPDVPATAEIVALGDSHTFGNTAPMSDSWPSVLSSVTGKTVYNMGLGGYGPNQYQHLLKTRALDLHPKSVVVGLYIGDDFENAYLITYALDHWKFMRVLPEASIDLNIWEAAPVAPSWHKRVRIWLSRHSVLYQMVFHGPLLGRTQGELQIKNPSLVSPDVVTLDIPAENILEAFRPRNVLKILDQNDERIREGMRLTFELLKEMNETCQERGISFAVAVIPTKEMVFADYLQRQPDLPMKDLIEALLANEKLARARTFEFFAEADIHFIDTLPSLRENLHGQLYARTASDMHPNGNGYRVIAEAIADDLRLTRPSD